MFRKLFPPAGYEWVRSRSTRRWVWLGVLFLGASLAIPGLAQPTQASSLAAPGNEAPRATPAPRVPARAGTAGCWVGVPSNGPGYLTAIALISSTDGWAAGSHSAQTLVEHWDGSAWAVVPSPNVGSANNYLTGVAAVAPNDVWAVGDYYPGQMYRTLIEHWDGSSWSIVPSPNGPSGGGYLNAVAAVAGNDVWAVGQAGGPLIEHWNGTTWSVVPGPTFANGWLQGITAVRANDVWAVGGYNNGSASLSLAEHWDGTSWTAVPTPNSGGNETLESVSAVASNDVWAVGGYRISGYDHPLRLHWDGAAWSRVAGPDTTILYGVAAVAANDVWAVGPATDSMFTEHWDGSTWTTVISPVPGPGLYYLYAVAAAGPGAIWAVGLQPGDALIARYAAVCPTATPTRTPTPTVTGTPPTVTPTPTPPPPTSTVTCVPGGYLSCNTSTCHAGTYNYDFYVYLYCGSPYLSVDLSFAVAASPGGPWTVYDEQTIPVYVNPGGGVTVTGSLTETNIPPQYAYYQFVVTGPGWFQPHSCTEGPAPLCRPGSPTPTAPPTVTVVRTATATPPATGTPPPTATHSPPPTGTPCAVSFNDVHPADYFYTPVQYLACHGVISGYADGTFRPYNPTTRTQLVKIVVLGFAIPLQTPPAGGYTFADVPPAQPFFTVIETAAAHSIISGYICGGPGEPCDDQHRPYFRPNANVTRGQLSKIVGGAAGWPVLNPATPTFRDVPPGSAFYPFVETAVCHGVVSGYADGTFRPGASATRGQISKIVYRAITTPPGGCAGAPRW